MTSLAPPRNTDADAVLAMAKTAKRIALTLLENILSFYDLVKIAMGLIYFILLKENYALSVAIDSFRSVGRSVNLRSSSVVVVIGIHRARNFGLVMCSLNLNPNYTYAFVSDFGLIHSRDGNKLTQYCSVQNCFYFLRFTLLKGNLKSVNAVFLVRSLQQSTSSSHFSSYFNSHFRNFS